MRRGAAVAVVLGSLIALTGCGPAGGLAAPSGTPAPSGSATPPPSSAVPTPTAAPTSTPTPTAEQPSNVSPPVTQPAEPGLPSLQGTAPMREVPIEGPHSGAGQLFDIVIACSIPLSIAFDGSGDADGLAEPGGPWVWCESGTALVLQRGVPGEHARAWMVLEDDLAPPLAVSVPAGEAFDAATIARLVAATGDAPVRVRVDCLEPGEFVLGAETAYCDPVLIGAVYFEDPVTIEQALTELVLPEGYTGGISLHFA